MTLAVDEKLNPVFGIDPVLYTQFLNWREKVFSSLTEPTINNDNLSMQGKIRTKEKCPKCQGKFIDTGKALICQKCLTMPNRFYLDIYWHGKQKVYSDKIGRPISSYELASRVLSEIRLEIEYKTFDPKDYQAKNFKKLQFKTYCREWLKRYQKALKCGDISPTYYRNLINYSEEHFIPFFKIKDIREIRAGEINEFYLNLPTKLSIKTKSNIMSVLKKIFNDALIDEYIEKVPRFKKISIPDPDWKWADEELQDQILDNIPVHHLPIFIFLTRQGVRPGEARAVQWQDFDFKNDQVKISKTFSENVLRPFPKPRRNKILPLDPEVKKILQNIPISIRRDDFAFYDRDLDKPYTTYKLSKLWRKACKKIGVDIKFYEGTRHSFASQAANRGVSIDLIGKFLGHQNQSSTRRYAHIKTESLKTVMRKKNKIKDSGKKVVKLRPQRGPEDNYEVDN